MCIVINNKQGCVYKGIKIKNKCILVTEQRIDLLSCFKYCMKFNKILKCIQLAELNDP